MLIFVIAVKLLLYVTNLAFCSMKVMALVYTGVNWESLRSVVVELEGEGGKIPQVISIRSTVWTHISVRLSVRLLSANRIFLTFCNQIRSLDPNNTS